MLIGYIPFIFLSDQGDMKQDATVWNIKPHVSVHLEIKK